MKKREEFDKVLVDITDLFLPEVSQGSWNFTHRNDDIKKIICSWHISEMTKMLESILEENKDKDFGTYDYNGIAESVIKLLNKFNSKSIK